MRGSGSSCRYRGLKQIAERGAGAEKAGPNRVQLKPQEISNFRVAQLLEFAQHDDFAVERLKFFNSAADPKARFRNVLFWEIRNRIALAQESGGKGSFAAIATNKTKATGSAVGSDRGEGIAA